MPEHLVVECLQRLVDWCVKYTRDEDRRGGLPPIPSGASLQSELFGFWVTGREPSIVFVWCRSLW